MAGVEHGRPGGPLGPHGHGQLGDDEGQEPRELQVVAGRASRANHRTCSTEMPAAYRSARVRPEGSSRATRSHEIAKPTRMTL